MNSLKPGDKIALIAPSGNPRSQSDVDIIAELIRQRGYSPIFSDNIIEQGLIEKIDDLHNVFSDNSINAVLTLRGGFSCNELLDLIDYSLIEKNKKLFIGFSDITALLVAFNKKSGLNSIHGPIFSEKQYLEESLLETVFGFMESKLSLNDLLLRMNFKILKKSDSSGGCLIGGNLFVLNNLIGTEYEPDWNNKVLFIESVGLSKEIILSIVEHFRQAKVFDKLSGLIIGDMGSSEEIVYSILHKLSAFDGFVLQTNNLGHVNNNIPLVLGSSISWDGESLKSAE